VVKDTILTDTEGAPGARVTRRARASRRMGARNVPRSDSPAMCFWILALNKPPRKDEVTTTAAEKSSDISCITPDTKHQHITPDTSTTH
jgi:hypothetical protein